jgi:hypothetical protein
MVAILKIKTRRFSKGTFPHSPPTRTLKINSIVQAVLREIDGSQFQDGGRGGHIENRNTPIFERNLPILTPYTHTNTLIDLIRRAVLLEIDGDVPAKSQPCWELELNVADHCDLYPCYPHYQSLEILLL